MNQSEMIPRGEVMGRKNENKIVDDCAMVMLIPML